MLRLPQPKCRRMECTRSSRLPTRETLHVSPRCGHRPLISAPTAVTRHHETVFAWDALVASCWSSLNTAPPDRRCRPNRPRDSVVAGGHSSLSCSVRRRATLLWERRLSGSFALPKSRDLFLGGFCGLHSARRIPGIGILDELADPASGDAQGQVLQLARPDPAQTVTSDASLDVCRFIAP